MRTIVALLCSLPAWVGYRLLVWAAKLQPYRTNCDLWAISQQRRFGGYIVLMPSLFYSWPHAVWTRDFVTFWQFVPNGARGKRTIPPVVFRGHEERWDIGAWEKRARVMAQLKARQQRRRWWRRWL